VRYRPTSARCGGRAEQTGKTHLVVYHELAGVGSPGHYGGITPEQSQLRDNAGARFLQENRQLIEIAPQGQFVVAGYLRTRRFDVVLQSVDRVAVLHYDLTKDRFALTAEKPVAAALRIRRSDGWDERELKSRDPGSRQ